MHFNAMIAFICNSLFLHFDWAVHDNGLLTTLSSHQTHVENLKSRRPSCNFWNSTCDVESIDHR